MLDRKFAPVALAGLLIVCQPAYSQETAVQQEQDDVAVIELAAAADEGQAPEAAAPADGNAAMTMPPGMMGQGMMGPGMKGCRTGMKGMMPGAMGKGGMKGCCSDRSGISNKQYRELMGRLDVIDARMAKIDAMLERLLER